MPDEFAIEIKRTKMIEAPISRLRCLCLYDGEMIRLLNETTFNLESGRKPLFDIMCFLALVRGEIIGWGYVYEYDLYSRSNGALPTIPAFNFGVFTDATYRRRGVGTTIVKAAIKYGDKVDPRRPIVAYPWEEGGFAFFSKIPKGIETQSSLQKKVDACRRACSQ